MSKLECCKSAVLFLIFSKGNKIKTSAFAVLPTRMVKHKPSTLLLIWA